MKKILIVEPAANVEIGHMREKLEVIVDAAARAGFKIHVVTWEPLAHDLKSKDIGFEYVSPLVRSFSSLIPSRYRVRFLEFCTYLKAFRFARSNQLPVVGMTSCDPWGPLIASLFCKPPSEYLHRMLHPGVSFANGSYRVSSKRVRGYYALVRSGGKLVIFNGFLKQCCIQLDRNLTEKNIRVIPEMMTCTELFCKKETTDIILVSGLDDARRTPLAHLAMLKNHPFIRKVILQHPDPRPPEVFYRDWPSASLSWEVERVSRYMTGKDWEDLFSSCTYTLVAYDEHFTQSSGIFLQSIAFGRPVVSSRFPDSVELFSKYGKLGVLFDYRSPVSLLDAIDEISQWTENDWQEFYAARRELVQAVDSDNVFAQYRDLIAAL